MQILLTNLLLFLLLIHIPCLGSPHMLGCSLNESSPGIRWEVKRSSEKERELDKFIV